MVISPFLYFLKADTVFVEKTASGVFQKIVPEKAGLLAI
jgi:hypothetical protein